MKCKFEHDEDCCNCGSPQYMCKCKPSICGCAVPMTNADRIRAMSDEELSNFMCELRSSKSYGFPCSECVAEEFCHAGHTGMIDWLQKQAEDDSDETD